MSRQDKLDPPESDDGPAEAPPNDDRLHVDLRLKLDEVAAAEEQRLRHAPLRRPTRRELAELALNLYDARRGRDRMFKEELFGEPGWDMLLALYGLPYRGHALGVTSLSHAANIKPTTGLRWQKVLFDEGLIERGPHCPDTRQHLVRLSDKGRILMERYLIRLFYCENSRAAADTDKVWHGPRCNEVPTEQP
jgi:DNA-binding MarR family transcriptional regulator